MKTAKTLKAKINNLLDNRQYDEALFILEEQISDFLAKEKDDLYLLAEIAGSFITLGSESYNIEPINIGLKLFIDNREALKNYITEDSIDYCLGNAYHAQYKISIKNVPGFIAKPDNIKYLFDAKQSYLKAYKRIDLNDLNSYSIQILTNLGSNLNHSGRIVEALQLFDMVLNFQADFPQAIAGKADTLNYMIRVTTFPISMSLFVEMFRLYKKAIATHIPIVEMSNVINSGLQETEAFLKNHNYDFAQMQNDMLQNKIEYENHSLKTKFYLDNYLSISEHALYCKCNAAKIDDLSIGFSGFTTTNRKLIQLEILLNRVKSEFSLARNLFYDFLHSESDENVYFETFHFDILNGIQYEKLRTSFRLCFGILDKLAEGIFHLFELEKGKNESIYFDSFWNNSNSQTQDRWEKINSINSIHITALYSIACDLNNRNGEFGFYKQWRNRLEHGVFSLTKSESDTLEIFNEKMFSEHTDELHFEEKTKHLLQLTRSAIFSFVYLTRQELLE